MDEQWYVRVVGYVGCRCISCVYVCFFFQAEDGIRDLVRSRGLGDVYKRQAHALRPALSGWPGADGNNRGADRCVWSSSSIVQVLSLIHI